MPGFNVIGGNYKYRTKILQTLVNNIKFKIV